MEGTHQVVPANAPSGDTTTASTTDTAAFLKMLHPDGACFEIRALGSGGGAGYAVFTNVLQAVAHVQRLERDAECMGIYVTLNPLQQERVWSKGNRAANDHDVASRVWLLIDLDPKRPSGSNSTEDELTAAMSRADKIESFLREQGWSAPLRVMSGNGCHLLYRIDLPAGDDGLVKLVLQALADMFSDDAVNLDTGVANPSRLTKVVGTTARKDVHSFERPQRMARWQNPGVQPQVVTHELLEKVGALSSKKTVQRLSVDGQPAGGKRPRPFVNMPLPQFPAIADKCAFVKHCVTDAAVLSEEEWYAAMGIVGRCADGERQAHEISAPYPSYDPAQTQAKLEHALRAAGPRTCRNIEQELGFAGCAQCPYHGRITSPIQLGRAGHDLLSFPLNDDGNADRFVLRCGEHIRHCVQHETWLSWDGMRWVADTFGPVRNAAIGVMREFLQAAREVDAVRMEAEPDGEGAAQPVSSPASRGTLLNFALRSGNAAAVESMLRFAGDRLAVNANQLDGDPWSVNCLNGTLDLQAGILKPHDPKELLTKLVPVAYDPKARCELWEKHLLTVFNGDQDLVDYFQKIVGYTLTGLTSEHQFFVLYGRGRNGKTVTLETLRALFGEYARNTPASTFLTSMQRSEIRNDVARLNGARFVTTSETAAGARIDTAMIKSITGGEVVTARFLHSEHFDFVPRFKLFMATNEAPEVPAHDMAIWERIRLIPFTVTIPPEQRDKQLLEKLTTPESLEGILAWAVRGCLRWQVEGLTPPESVRTATGEYRNVMDDVGAFLEECCEVNPGSGDYRVRPGELLKAYQAWAIERGETPMTQKILAARMGSKGFESKKANGERTYRGVRLKTVESRTPAPGEERSAGAGAPRDIGTYEAKSEVPEQPRRPRKSGKKSQSQPNIDDVPARSEQKGGDQGTT